MEHARIIPRTDPRVPHHWEAAEIAHQGPYPVLEAIRRGELVAFQPDPKGPYLIRPTDLRAYVEAAKA